VAGRARALSVGLVVLAVVIGASALVRWRSPHLDVMLETDEADYVRAAAYGVAAAYLGTRERSGAAFAAEVFDGYRRTGAARPFKRDWDAGDAAGLRHYHPPLALYPVAAMAGAGVRDERTLRAASLGAGLLACLASALLGWVLLARAAPGLRLAVAAVAGLATGASSYHVLASTTVGPHAAFSFVATAALAALTVAMRSPRAAWWYLACGGVGLAALTVPYAILLVPAALWAWWAGPAADGRYGRLAIGLLVVLVAATVAWPPFVLSGGFVKPVILYAHIAMSPPDVGRSTGDWVLDLARSHAVISALIAVGLAGFFAAGREQRRAAVPAVLFVAGFIALNLRVTYMKPLYVADVVPALAALAAASAGWAIAKLPLRLATLTATVTAAALAVSASLSTAAFREPADWRGALDALDARFAGERILVTPRPAGPMLTYYLDAVDVVLDSDHPDDVAGLAGELAAGDIDAVVRWGSLVDPRGAAAGVIAARPPDGNILVDATPVWWWRVAR
jgi:hypothetical protein